MIHTPLLTHGRVHVAVYLIIILVLLIVDQATLSLGQYV